MTQSHKNRQVSKSKEPLLEAEPVGVETLRAAYQGQADLSSEQNQQSQAEQERQEKRTALRLMAMSWFDRHWILKQLPKKTQQRIKQHLSVLKKLSAKANFQQILESFEKNSATAGTGSAVHPGVHQGQESAPSNYQDMTVLRDLVVRQQNAGFAHEWLSHVLACQSQAQLELLASHKWQSASLMVRMLVLLHCPDEHLNQICQIIIRTEELLRVQQLLQFVDSKPSNGIVESLLQAWQVSPEPLIQSQVREGDGI